MEKLTLVKIQNPFNRRDREISTLEYEGPTTLNNLRDEQFPSGLDVVISINGKVASVEEWPLTFVRPSDCVVFTPMVHGGDSDGKDVLRIVAMIAIMIAAPYAAAGLSGLMELGLAAGSGGMLALTGAVMLVGGLLVNALLPPVQNTADTSSLSTAYGWSPQTTQQQGLVVPRFYGYTKLTGNIIAANLESDGDNNYIDALISLGLGRYKAFSDFKLNDQSTDNYSGVIIETRLGYVTQTPISNFNDTKVEFNMAIKVVNGTPYTYTTVGDDFGGLEIEVTFPLGLWHTDSDGGNLLNNSVNYRVEVRQETSPGVYSPWKTVTSQVVDTTLTASTGWSAGYWAGDFGGYYWYELAHGDTNPYSHYEGEQYCTGTGEADWCAGVWSWGKMDYQYTVSQTVDYATASGNSATAIKKTVTVGAPPKKGKCDIRVTNLTADQTDTSKYGDDMYLTTVREVYVDDFSYPRHALVGIKALASDQLSGSLNFSCMAECAGVLVYNGSNYWQVSASSNPAWVAWDILTQPVIADEVLFDTQWYQSGNTAPTSNVLRYDGIDPARLDLVKFKEWAAWCDTLVTDGEGGTQKRCTFNGGFDAETTMWEAALQVCQVGRAILVWNGVNLTVAIDKAASPVQMFTVGNIGLDSFQETFLPQSDRASEIEIDFIDSTNNYERNKLSVFNVALNTKTNKVNLQLFGIVTPAEAWRAGMYRLYQNQYILRTVDIDVDIDAIACTIGDVVNVQHDIPQWGYGGRVVSATSGTVTLDKEVVISAGKSYSIMVRLSDDSIVEKSVTDGAGVYTTLTVSSPFTSVPQKFDVYAFGEVNKVVKPFRVMNISRTQEQKAEIGLVEYNASIYNVDTDQPVLPTTDYSSLNSLPSVVDLTLDELLLKGADGTLTDNIDVYFSKPSGQYGYAEIWFNSGAGWSYAGDAKDTWFRISNVLTGKTYTVAVVTVNTFGGKQTIQNSPQASVYTLGKSDLPSNVTGFAAKQNGQLVDFNWTHIPDADLWGYELRQGTAWDSAVVITTGVQQNQYTWQAKLNGTYRFLIKAIDDSNLYSNSAASVDITLAGIDENLNIIISQDEMTKGSPADGTKTNLIYVSGYHSLMLPHTLLDTDVSALVDTSASITGYKGDITLAAEYITVPIDTFKDGDTWIRIVESIDANETGATDQSYPSRTDLTYIADTDTHITMPVDYAIYYAWSDDNVTYSGWIKYNGTAQENFRYVKVKFTVNLASATGRFKLLNFLLSFDVPDVDFTIAALSVAASTGTDISYSTYGKSFYSTPVVRGTLINDTTAKVPVVSNQTATGCHIDLLNTSNAKVAGQVNLDITGY